MEECACLCGVGSSRGCRCHQEHQGPAEKAAAHSKPAPAEKHLEVNTAASLTLACTKFYHILPIDSIWRRRCRAEYGVRETLPNLEMIGLSYREVYMKLFHPYRHILGLWQLDKGYRRLLNVVVDGLGITGWTCRPSLNPHGDGPMQSEPLFRMRLTERKSAAVECKAGRHRRPHNLHMQIQKDRFSIKTDHRKDSPTRPWNAWGRVLVQEVRQPCDCLTYRRLYLPFHGKHARVTNITGFSIRMLEIHLRHRIQLPDGGFFRNFNELSHVVQEIDQHVIREQQQQFLGLNASSEEDAYEEDYVLKKENQIMKCYCDSVNVTQKHEGNTGSDCGPTYKLPASSGNKDSS
ncbi:F-box only protein 31-like [Myotis daubentonii]|uniref:F-box only protein 31-like n=1 Tax=Myotis daubentonii TaxID=98922 RepID=UPI0028732380|nr:F-box only protein 31-like [Myotis daubentonii]